LDEFVNTFIDLFYINFIVIVLPFCYCLSLFCCNVWSAVVMPLLCSAAWLLLVLLLLMLTIRMITRMKGITYNAVTVIDNMRL